MAETISIKRELCLNFRYENMNCRRCQESCLQGCIGENLKICSNTCNKCGLCIAACPEQAIVVEGFSWQNLMEKIGDGGTPFKLACHKTDNPNGWPCLGFLDGKLLMALVYSGVNKNRIVIVDDSCCSDCKPRIFEYLQELLGKTNRLLVSEGKDEIIHGNDVKDVVIPDKNVTRRDFFASIFQGTINAAREIVAIDYEFQGFPRQEWYEKYVGQLSLSGPAELFPNLAIDSSCQACGMCGRICPHKAISLEDYNEFIDIYHSPQNCNSCGLCVEFCQQRAITMQSGSQLGKYRAARSPLPRCKRCDQLFQPNGDNELCLECQLR